MGTSAVAFRLGHIFGKEFLEDLSVYFHLFKDLYDGFGSGRRPWCRCSPSRARPSWWSARPPRRAPEVASFFLDELFKRRMPNPGVVNQRHQASAEPLDAKALGEAAAAAADDLSAHTAASSSPGWARPTGACAEPGGPRGRGPGPRAPPHAPAPGAVDHQGFEEDVHDISSLARWGCSPRGGTSAWGARLGRPAGAPRGSPREPKREVAPGAVSSRESTATGVICTTGARQTGRCASREVTVKGSGPRLMSSTLTSPR